MKIFNKRSIFSIVFNLIICLNVALIGKTAMSDEGHEEYLSDKETVDKVYGYLQNDQTDSAAAYLKGLGEDKIVVNTWINVQCDINNVKGDPKASAELGRMGVDYCLEKGHKPPAAMMLHNIGAFLMPDFDEGVDTSAIPMVLDAARQQVPLRREIGQPIELMWALWDLGLAELAAGNAVEAINVLREGARIAMDDKDDNAAAWCSIFIGKAMVKHMPERKSEGRQKMHLAAKTIMTTGEDWEKEGVKQILESVGLSP